MTTAIGWLIIGIILGGKISRQYYLLTDRLLTPEQSAELLFEDVI